MSASLLASRVARAALCEFVAGLPDRLRYEVQRHQQLEPVVDRTPPTLVVKLEEWRWRCPDANYDWHYSVDDQGYAETPDEAFDLGTDHVQRFHRLRWSEHADRRVSTPSTTDTTTNEGHDHE